MASLERALNARTPWAVFLTALVLSAVLFAPSIGGAFVFDDGIVIVGNPLIGGVPDVGSIFSTSYHAYQPRTGLYRPLVILSYALNAWLFGDGPVSFHIVNIVLHAGVIAAVFVLVRMLLTPRIAGTAALLFAVLPIHVEAVASIVGRAELMMALGFLGAVIAGLSGRSLLSAALLFAGLLSKETAIAAIPVLGVLLWYRGAGMKEVMRVLRWHALSLVSFLALRVWVLGEHAFSTDASMVYNPIAHASSWLAGLGMALRVVWEGFLRVWAPLSLSSDYSYSVFSGTPLWSVAIGAAILLTALYAIVRYRNDLRGYAGVLFLFPLLVIANIILPIGTIFAERLWYVPSIGLAILAAGIFVRIHERWQRMVQVSGVLLVVIYALVSFQRSGAWVSEEALFQSAFAAQPDSVVNQTNMAYLDLKNERLTDARARIDAVLSLTPEHAPALNLAGAIAQRQGDHAAAEAFWKRAIKARPDYLNAYRGLGALYYDAGYFADAHAVLSDALAIYPRWSEVWYLSLVDIALGKTADAKVLLDAYASKAVPDEFLFAHALLAHAEGRNIEAQALREQVVTPRLRRALDDVMSQ
ncbi:MAG: tetratricopeptide repeat protein [Patescibacteria group bacterium]